MCQKPLTPTLAEAHALVSAVGERVPFMIHENWRFRAPYRLARSWIKDRRIGDIRRFDIATESSGLLPPSEGATLPALERQPFFADLHRLIIFELLIHHLDLARALCGELKVVGSVTGSSSSAVRGESSACIVLEGTNVFGTVIGDFCVPGAPPNVADRMDLIGSEGRMTLQDGVLKLYSKYGSLLETKAFGIEDVPQTGYDAAIAHFVESLRAGQPFETSPRDNLATLALVDQAYARRNTPSE